MSTKRNQQNAAKRNAAPPTIPPGPSSLDVEQVDSVDEDAVDEEETDDVEEIDELPAENAEVGSTEPPAAPQHKPEPVESLELAGTVTIRAPRLPLVEGAYMQRKVEARLSQDQRKGLKMLTMGLHHEHARLASGKHVDSPADAVRWLLEQIANETN